MLEVGMQASLIEEVTPKNTADQIGKGGLPVFSTPALVALVEKLCLEFLGPHLGQDEATVGTKLEVAHNAATPIGMKIKIVATLKSIEGRKLGLEIRAFDDNEEVAVIQHERYIVNSTKFMEKALKKRR